MIQSFWPEFLGEPAPLSLLVGAPWVEPAPVSPPDAAVYLDGEFLAQADELRRLHGALPVAAGNHIVEVVRPGYVSERQRIEVIDGDVARVAIQLGRAEESP